MTDRESNTPDAAPETRDERIDRVEEDAEAMERRDRAIPLPDEDGEEEEGVGQITGIVP